MKFKIGERVEIWPELGDYYKRVVGRRLADDGIIEFYLQVGDRGHVVSVASKADRLRARSAGLNTDTLVKVRFGDGEYYVREDQLRPVGIVDRLAELA
jgi:hypothetical protein